ncbi:unnamed protein product [Candidula unifasciata]|uniref:Uncharacterized protein n=1 Tax=Candidula unifasciata TaxID=100452 RepID=A0A8S3YYA0_9EUPU|nr:unnamed protein product [Candidula unifasciata]
MDSSHRLWRLVYLFLFTLWRPRILVQAGINSTHLHMGRDITRIVTNEFQDIYIGGVNFIAQLTPKLFIKLNITIGPVTTSEHCAPNPAPCDNIVRVLEIDAVQKMLLVCGSAYQGTCTIHSLQDIDVWFCLNSETNSAGAEVVSGSHERNSVLHFLPSTVRNSQMAPVVAARECRSKGFGQKYVAGNDSQPKYVRMQHYAPRIRFRRLLYSAEVLSKRDIRENVQSLGGIFKNNFTGLHNSGYHVQSNVMIAGSVYNPKLSTNPLHLSIRRITFNGSQYTIGYSRDHDTTPVGFQMKNAKDTSITPDYKLSFTWGNYSYFVFLQQSTDCEKTSRCIQTKISRTCNDPLSILPYVEITLMCTDKVKYITYVYENSNFSEYNEESFPLLGNIGPLRYWKEQVLQQTAICTVYEGLGGWVRPGEWRIKST